MIPSKTTLSSWSKFCKTVDSVDIQDFGFIRPLADVNRFAARYRVARSFRGINFEDMVATTSKCYGDFTRMLLTYSAFEVFLHITGKSQSTIGPKLERAGSPQLMSHLREIDRDSSFYAFLHERVNANHQAQLEYFMAHDPCNVAYLASSIRHIFAHGWLTPHAGGGDPELAGKICSAISEFLLKFMDQLFSIHIDKGLNTLQIASSDQ